MLFKYLYSKALNHQIIILFIFADIISLNMAHWLSDNSDEETRKYKGGMVQMLTEMTIKERKVRLITIFL